MEKYTLQFKIAFLISLVPALDLLCHSGTR